MECRFFSKDLGRYLNVVYIDIQNNKFVVDLNGQRITLDDIGNVEVVGTDKIISLRSFMGEGT